jgi:aldehyde dehydrogenase (NAD+)
MIAETTEQEIDRLIAKQKTFFESLATLPANFRRAALKTLKQALKAYEQKLSEALWKDLHKSAEEAYLTEINIVASEIEMHLTFLEEWMRTEQVQTPLVLLPSRSEIRKEPLGQALIIAPWNYPVQLVLNPLVGALSSGCCAMLKPSPIAPHTALVLEALVRDYFSEEHVCVVQGSKPTNEILFKKRFDLIFFTGSTALGKIVMKAAAEQLTPVILELGGKSPTIVDRDANLALSAKRIAWGKCMNAGQTCIAPDYVFVHETIKQNFIKALSSAIDELCGADASQTDHYARIVSEDAFERLSKLKEGLNIVYGGKQNKETRFMQMSLVDGVTERDAIMQEEIFGPILPIMSFEKIEEVLRYIRAHEKPLALYYFGSDAGAEKVLAGTSSGGVCINDTLLHIGNHHLPFGGVGQSGMGTYHGKKSFLAFSHERAIVRSSKRIDLPFKYAPYKFFKWIKKVM